MPLQFLALAALLAPPPLLYKGPIVQEVTETSAVLLWEVGFAEDLTVLVEGPGGVAQTHHVKPEGPFPAMVSQRVTGLSPGQRYQWRLHGARGQALNEGHIRTQAGPERPFNFIVYGDNRSDHRAHKAVVDAMGKEAAELWINTGDLVGNGGRLLDWAYFFAIETPHLRGTPVLPVIGNHEVVGGGEALFARYFQLPGNELYYASTWGNVRFIFMDTYVHTDQGAPNAAQQAFLLEETARAEADPSIDHVVGVVHAGPYSSHPRRSGNPPLRPLLERLQAAGMDLLLSGHDHFYERGTTDAGLRYLVVGCGGAPLYQTVGPGHHEGYTAHASRSTYAYVRMRSVGPMLQGCAVDLDGVPFDCFDLISPEGSTPKQGTPPKAPQKKAH